MAKFEPLIYHYTAVNHQANLYGSVHYVHYSSSTFLVSADKHATLNINHCYLLQENVMKPNEARTRVQLLGLGADQSFRALQHDDTRLRGLQYQALKCGLWIQNLNQYSATGGAVPDTQQLNHAGDIKTLHNQ